MSPTAIALALYCKLLRKGVSLRTDGRLLLASPSHLVTAAERVAIRAYKPELMALVDRVHRKDVTTQADPRGGAVVVEPVPAELALAVAQQEWGNR